MLAIVVEFEVAAPDRGAFLDLVLQQARASLDREPACRRFDVCEDHAAQSRLLLYEIYDDEAAFRLHLASTHYAEFDARTRPLYRQKTVSRFEVHEGSP